MKKNGKYCNGKKGLNMKPLAVLLALTLLVGCAIGGTLAWLTAQTGPVQNTFSSSDINITLTEKATDFKMVPGHTIEKDPVVTVLSGSEDCWVFVKVEKSRNLDEYIEFAIDSTNWKKLDNAEGILPTEAVYYCYAKDVTADLPIKVLENQQVTVKDTVTKEMLNQLAGANAARPSLTFKAYAVQLYKSNGVEFTPGEAWAQRPTT